MFDPGNFLSDKSVHQDRVDDATEVDGLRHVDADRIGAAVFPFSSVEFLHVASAIFPGNDHV